MIYKKKKLTFSSMKQLASVKMCIGLIKVPKQFPPFILISTRKGWTPVPSNVFSEPRKTMPHCFISGRIVNLSIEVFVVFSAVKINIMNIVDLKAIFTY